MANSFQTVSSGLANLKNFYAGTIKSQFNDSCPVYKAAEQGKEPWSGYQVIRPVKVRRNTGIGAVAEGGNLPSIGRQTTVQAIIANKSNYLRFGVSAQMIAASKNDKGAYVRQVSFEMSEGMKDLISDVNRQCSWNGDGTLATVSANATSSSVITVTGRESVEAGNKFLDVGMVVDIYDSTFATLKASGVSITALSGTTTATLTLSAPVTCVSTDVLVRAGSQGQEIQGLLTQMDGLTTTVFNVDRSAYPSFQSNSISLSNGQLTLDGLQQAYNEARRRGNGKIAVLWTDFDTERFYTKLLTADKRYVNSVKGDGGWTKTEQSYLEFNGSPVCPDKDSPRRVFMMTDGVLTKYVLSELEWASESGSELIVQTGSDTFEVRLRLFANLFNEFPAACAVVKSYISP